MKFLNMVDKIKNILKNKRIYYAIFFIVVIVVIVYVFSNKRIDTEFLEKPSSSAVSKSISVLPKRSDKSLVYQINMFETRSEVLDYGWNGKKIMYATKDGVFDLWKNNPIIDSSTENTYFNNNGSIIYSFGPKYYLYRQSDNTKIELGENLFGIQINKNNTSIIFQNRGILNIKNISTNENTTKQIPNVADITFGFIKNKDYVYISNRITKLISIYDYGFNLVKELRLPEKNSFVEISPESEYVLSVSNNYLHFSDFNSEIKTVGFDNDSEINASWIDKERAVVVETRKRGSLDISDNFIWTVSKTGSKEYIANSFPVRNNFNTKIKPVISPNNNAIMLSENKGNLWVISLLSSKIPVYEEAGINFFNIDTKREDNFQD